MIWRLTIRGNVPFASLIYRGDWEWTGVWVSHKEATCGIGGKSLAVHPNPEMHASAPRLTSFLDGADKEDAALLERFVKPLIKYAPAVFCGESCWLSRRDGCCLVDVS